MLWKDKLLYIFSSSRSTTRVFSLSYYAALRPAHKFFFLLAKFLSNHHSSHGHQASKCMNRLCPLFSHQASTNSPSSHPWDNMVFKDMHFRENASLGGLLAIGTHEGDYLILRKAYKNKLLISFTKVLFHTLFHTPKRSMSVSLMYLDEL